jgi:predicted membrane protein
MRTNHRHRSGLVPGLILAFVGAGLLMRELGLLPAHVRSVDFWPLVVVVVGISTLMSARGRTGVTFALLLAALGVLLLAGNLGLVAFPAARLWPLLLVLLGFAILIRGARSREREGSSESAGGMSVPRAGAFREQDRFSKQITFSGLDCRIESQAWNGGELGVTGGGVELDLRYAQLAPEGALLDVRIVMGGVDIRVPDTWQVMCDVTPLLGGADDTTRSTQGSTGAPVLRVTGTVTLGGLTIRN